jgi:hypothetical protein
MIRKTVIALSYSLRLIIHIASNNIWSTSYLNVVTNFMTQKVPHVNLWNSPLLWNYEVWSLFSWNVANPSILCQLVSTGAYGWQPHCHLWSNCPDKVGASTSHSCMGFHRLLQEQLYFKNYIHLPSLCAKYITYPILPDLILAELHKLWCSSLFYYIQSHSLKFKQIPP